MGIWEYGNETAENGSELTLVYSCCEVAMVYSVRLLWCILPSLVPRISPWANEKATGKLDRA